MNWLLTCGYNTRGRLQAPFYAPLTPDDSLQLPNEYFRGLIPWDSFGRDSALCRGREASLQSGIAPEPNDGVANRAGFPGIKIERGLAADRLGKIQIAGKNRHTVLHCFQIRAAVGLQQRRQQQRIAVFVARAHARLRNRADIDDLIDQSQTVYRIKQTSGARMLIGGNGQEHRHVLKLGTESLERLNDSLKVLVRVIAAQAQQPQLSVRLGEPRCNMRRQRLRFGNALDVGHPIGAKADRPFESTSLPKPSLGDSGLTQQQGCILQRSTEAAGSQPTDKAI